MFVFSVKSQRSKIIAAILIILLALLGFIVCSQLDTGSGGGENGTTLSEPANVETDNTVSYNAADGSERLEFIKQFGWECSEEPSEIMEVLIPAEFDEVYERYNELQKSQGLDLSDYKGQRVKRWSYQITNYPGYEESSQIRINLLVCKGVVIGGDVCSLAEDGFMCGFADKTSGTEIKNES